MLEATVVIFGMCLTFVPVVLFVNYLLRHVKYKQEFDYHIDKVRDKKGLFGVVIAYIERLLLGVVLISLGIYLSSFCLNYIFVEIFVISLLLYIFFHFIDEKNEK